MQGKGSTSAFAESMLRSAGYTTGLFTSPHLVRVNERIRLGGRPISDDKMCKYFWEVWDKLQATRTPELDMPAYFRFLTMLGFYVFIEEKVDVAIIEVGLGGRIDSTNVLRTPLACGIASLGYDHTELLGDTLAKIAREKAGIMKRGAPAFTVPQEDEAMQSLTRCAEEVGVALSVAKPLESYEIPPNHAGGVRLGINGEHQSTNAALALALCDAFQRADATPPPNVAALVSGGSTLTAASLEGLGACHWPGRGQIERQVAGQEDNVVFYLDGAHTQESMACCSRWYHDAVRRSSDLDLNASSSHERWLMFNCMKERDPSVLLGHVASHTDWPFHRAMFVPFQSSMTHLDKTHASDLTWESSLKRTWDGLPSPPRAAASTAMPSIAAALQELGKHARQNKSKQIHVLVTGSIYLVGDFLRILQRVP